MEEAIRAKLEYDPNQPLTKEAVYSLHSLEIHSSKVHSLRGLEDAGQLVMLTLTDSKVTDFTPVLGLQGLRVLDLSRNEIVSLAPFASLRDLAELNVSHNQIKDLSPLSKLTKLEKLNVSGNQITSLDPLSGLAELNVLDCSDNQVSSLKPLLKLTNLTKLSVSKNLLDLTDTEIVEQINTLKRTKVTQFVDAYTEQKAVPKSKLLLDWTEVTGLEASYSWNYAYGNGRYVTAASEGNTMVSTDGLNWTRYYSGDSQPFMSIVWGKNEFLGFKPEGWGNTVWSSKDGITWTKHKEKFGTGSCRLAAWNGKRYVAVDGGIYTSEDGQKWTKRSLNLDTQIQGLAYGNGVFVGQGEEWGQVVVSSDGITWKTVKTKQPNYHDMYDIAFGGGLFVAVGGSTIMTSKDGTTWTYISAASSKTTLSQVMWAKDRFYIYGSEYTPSRKPAHLTSKDGKKWTSAGFTNSPNQEPQFTLYNGKQYVTATTAGFQTSANGVKWTQAFTYPLFDTGILQDSAVGNGNLVMVGGHYDSFRQVEQSYQSAVRMGTDGKWKGSSIKGTLPLTSVVWTGKDFFAVGYSGKMMTSTDGLAWKAIASPTKETLSSVAYANGNYYVSGTKGTILTSTDRVKWKKANTGVSVTLNSIAANDKMVVAVGKEGTLIVSKDGVNWTKPAKLFKGDLYDVVWGNGKFVATGQSHVENREDSTVLVSSDGTTWKKISFKDETPEGSVSTPGLYGVSAVGGLFVAVGSGGAVFVSEDAEKWKKQPAMTAGTWLVAAEFKGSVYLVGNSNKTLVAKLP
ncbi:leucine-rich repeat domain-containing protein [Gorillibacterium timonense]|uniref:leucine-rich repeat domain-containing protein n=1 Tax=Gorillibacterium timonense TaxID=1689269 RepID=UPI00071C848C|nr:leucine-rich repeat domain-containing protein [Gorillibacterium timonense]